ncbi:MAG: hypothetical protein ACRDTT_15730, partial [Pseudonocardiaceae bacterium]
PIPPPSPVEAREGTPSSKFTRAGQLRRIRRCKAPVESCGCRTRPEIGRYLIGGDHVAALNVFESSPEFLDELGVGQDLDGLPQPVELAGRHDIGHVFTVRDDRHGLPSLGTTYSVFPHRGLLTGRVQVIDRDADRLLTHVFQDTALPR